MKNQIENLIRDDCAKNEPHVKANEILAEIHLLLGDYFEGRIFFDGTSITYCLPNGQKFKLSAEEIA